MALRDNIHEGDEVVGCAIQFTDTHPRKVMLVTSFKRSGAPVDQMTSFGKPLEITMTPEIARKLSDDLRALLGG
jgi:hypothetical protein